MEPVAVSVVIPTRNRAPYLAVALDTLSRQDADVGYEVLVVDDGSSDDTPAVSALAGVRYVELTSPRGLNAARNAGVRAAAGSLIAFLDDDVCVPPGWIRALHEGAQKHSGSAVFGGPIHPRFEGPTPSSCGRDAPAITALDLGGADHEVTMVWGANFAVRRQAFEQHGLFDETIAGHGDEEEWLLAARARGAQITYLAAADVEHRRTREDARLRPLARAAYRRGRGARTTDARRGVAPPLHRELRVLAGCAWHTVRRRCPQGIIMGAHAAGRLSVAVRNRGTRGPG